MSGPRRSRVGLFLAAALIALLCASMLLLRVQNGIESSFDLSAASAARAIGGWLGVAEPLAPTIQLVAEGRLVDGLAAVLVGAALALSGALLQGLFRNELASPGLIGVSSGASLGAVVAILIAGGEILEIQESDGAGGEEDDGLGADSSEDEETYWKRWERSRAASVQKALARQTGVRIESPAPRLQACLAELWQQKRTPITQ